MQKLAEICISRPVFATMLILTLVVIGATGYMKLGVDRVPSVDLPVVSVRTTLEGASPEEMESDVSRRLEEAINTVEGLEELRSISTMGSSLVIATFKLSRGIEDATQDVRDRVNAVLKNLPEDVDPPIIQKRNNDDDPVMTFALYGPRSKRELTEIAERSVKERIERSSGVGEVFVNGGISRTINIWVDPDKLAKYSLPISAVRDAIVRQNSDIPGGNVTGRVREQQLRVMGKITDPRKFNDLAITRIKEHPIHVHDIGWAEDGTREQRSWARLWRKETDGEKPEPMSTVTLSVKRQSGANSVEVIEGVKANLQKVQQDLPPDVQIEVIRDQSIYIYNALHEINVHLWAGSALASLVVLAFMRNWRSTIIAAIAIPTSVVSTFGMMWALHFTLNSVTMLALVLMVGVVIDDAIVVLENIFRFVEEKQMDSRTAAREATREIGLAVLATTLSLVIIFIPVSFMSSISGRFLYQFGITAAVAVMVSLLVSFTLTPMMSSRMLKAKPRPEGQGAGHAEGGSRRGFYHWIDLAYSWMLRWSMRLRWGVAALALVVMWTAVPLYRSVKQEWVPTDVDEAEFQVGITAPEGTSPESMNRAMRSLEEEIVSVRGVRLVLGVSGGTMLGASNSGSIHVRIAPHEERTLSVGRLLKATLRGRPSDAWAGNYNQRDVMMDIRRKLSRYRDLRPSVRNYMAFSLGGSSSDIDFVIRGPELERLFEYADNLRMQIKTGRLEGMVDADITLKLDKPELRIVPDRDRAADLEIDAQEIGDAMRLMVGGDTQVSRFRDNAMNEDYDVQLRLSEGTRNDVTGIDRLYLRRKNGDLVQLSNLTRIEPAKAAGRIDRLDKQRCVNLRAQIAPGAALGDRIQAMRAAAADLNMAAGYSTTAVGKAKELERTFGEFLWAFLLSVIFMYIILAMNYESLVHPLTILLSLPLTVPFALLSLYLTSGTLNLYSALGLLVLFGVVKKNAILQIDHMNQLRRLGMSRFDAIMQGNRDRLRPILMTTLALVAGMAPLALGTGPGAEERRAVAIVVIGGQSLSLLLTLLVTPVAYSIFDDIGAIFYHPKRTQPGAPAPLPRQPGSPLLEREPTAV